jgi:Fur family peroxide stress response transcriptional regulator
MNDTAKTIDKQMAVFDEMCKGRGIKSTHQRREVYRELARTREHPDTDTVYRRVRKRIPTISLDTVYRTLRLLEDQGIISRYGSLGERTRFDANVAPHHHFVCIRCGLVEDFHSEALDHWHPPAAVRAIGAVRSVHVELRGLCKICQQIKP